MTSPSEYNGVISLPDGMEFDQTEFDSAEDAVHHALIMLFYSAGPQYTADYLVNEALPSRGWKIVKMTNDERKQWESEYGYDDELDDEEPYEEREL